MIDERCPKCHSIMRMVETNKGMRWYCSNHSPPRGYTKELLNAIKEEVNNTIVLYEGLYAKKSKNNKDRKKE